MLSEIIGESWGERGQNGVWSACQRHPIASQPRSNYGTVLWTSCWRRRAAQLAEFRRQAATLVCRCPGHITKGNVSVNSVATFARRYVDNHRDATNSNLIQCSSFDHTCGTYLILFEVVGWRQHVWHLTLSTRSRSRLLHLIETQLSRSVVCFLRLGHRLQAC